VIDKNKTLKEIQIRSQVAGTSDRRVCEVGQGLSERFNSHNAMGDLYLKRTTCQYHTQRLDIFAKSFSPAKPLHCTKNPEHKPNQVDVLITPVLNAERTYYW
jgi:hypothetical protein